MNLGIIAHNSKKVLIEDFCIAYKNMGYGCAKSVILFLIIAAISLIQLNITRKREVQS